MHQHYHTIRQLSAALRSKLVGAVLVDAYTLSKEELFLMFQFGQDLLSIKVLLKHQHCFLMFGDVSVKRPSNAQAIFAEVTCKKITAINQHPYNRSFELCFEDDYVMVFKMYDALANVILFQHEMQVDLFRPQINNDLLLTPTMFYQVDEPMKAAIEAMKANDNRFVIIKKENDRLPYRLVFEHSASEVYHTNDVLDALNQFARLNLAYLHFVQLKQSVIQSLKAELKRAQSLIEKSEEQLLQKEQSITPEQIGHLIMANLHAIAPGSEKVELDDFYHHQPITIKLKKDLTPADNAAYYYRKGRNQKIEFAQLKNKIQHSTERIQKLQKDLDTVSSANEIKLLKPFVKEKVKKEETIPFKVFTKNGYTIWVGKSAANNDMLTTKYAHKNDLWLHAKDVSGSHVVVKHQGGVFPQQVIEYAAGIAAYYSKLKGSALVPVSYTLKKFVRKPKGMEPGQVIVDKEDVVLVKPSVEG